MLSQSAWAAWSLALGLAFILPVLFTGCTPTLAKTAFDLIIADGRILYGPGKLRTGP